MNKNKLNINIGGEYMTLTFVALLVLKLCNVINWSWWWVTAPLWIPLAIFLGIMGIILLVALVVECFQ